MKKNWTIFNGLVFCSLVLLILSGCWTNEEDTKTTISGKVIQSAVSGATVFLDVDGDNVPDAGEPSTITNSDGSFVLDIPDDRDGRICSVGGIVVGENREALPMLAPRDAENISSLTTLVALNPDLKGIIGSNWDKDPSSVTMKGEILQLKFVIESYLAQFKSIAKTNAEQLSAASILAGEIAKLKDLDSDSDLKTAIATAVGTVVAIGDGDSADALTSMETAVAKSIIEAVQGIVDVIEESDDNLTLTDLENTVHKPSFAYDPTNKIIPLPNDVAWAATGGKVVIDTSAYTDASQKALYTAVNKLENPGLSPNTPISVPLTSGQELDSGDFAANIILFEITNNDFSPVPAEDITIAQDENFIKIYPLEPFNSSAKYLVVVKTGIKIKGSTDTIGTNNLFELLKASFELDSDSLEALRQSYAPLFAGLGLAGIPSSDILTLFTFTTASKTLSLPDYGMISATIAAGGNPDDMTITGLPLSSVNAEYDNVNTGVASAVAAAGSPGFEVTDTEFVSFDITTLTEVLPTRVNVPYKIYNPDENADKIIIFQHGFNGYKEQAAAFAARHLTYTVIAIDLPLHGDRDLTPDDDSDSGSTFLTSNLGQDRINLYQSFFDISVLLQCLNSGKFSLGGEFSTKETPTDIYFVGMSLGSMTGSVAVEKNIADVDKCVLNVAGGNFAAIFDTAKSALLTSILTELDLEKNSPEYFISLGVIQLLMDPADPVNKVTDALGAKTVFQFAYKDTVVSNIANEIIADAAGIDNDVDVEDMSDDLTGHAPYADTVFRFGGDSSKTKNWMPHGFLISPAIASYPEASAYLDESYVSDGYDAVNDLTSQYLGN